jgi:hypothetical protein
MNSQQLIFFVTKKHLTPGKGYASAVPFVYHTGREEVKLIKQIPLLALLKSHFKAPLLPGLHTKFTINR